MPSKPEAKTESTKKGPLDTYKSLGVSFSDDDGKEFRGTCPFCGKEKFHVNSKSGKFQCFVCGSTGNPVIFLRRLWEESFEATTDDDYQQLVLDRGPFAEGFKEWGVCKSNITGQWLIPAGNVNGKLTQLYRHTSYGPIAAAAMGHGLFGVQNFNPNATFVDICEGPWDGMAWAEATMSWEDNTVVSSPGCNVWKASWRNLFKDKVVRILYDSDHEKPHPKIKDKMIPPAGIEGVRRVASELRPVATEIYYMNWGPNYYNEDWPSGTDIRDILTEKVKL